MLKTTFMQMFIQRLLNIGLNILFRNRESVANRRFVRNLMTAFKADEYGHEANYEHGDLGYGWIHYGIIRQQKPKRILCVGSRHGFIPAVLAQACKDNGFGRVDFVDAGFDQDDQGGWTGEGYWRTPSGRSAFAKYGLDQYVSLFVMLNHEFAQKYTNNLYDYVYIDGDHSLKGVILDFKLFWPMLNRGGFMSFHDICVKEPKPEGTYGVWKFWQILSNKVNGIEINFIGSGLGLVQKK